MIRRISVQSSGDAGTEIVASLSPQDEVLRVLSFNHSPDLKKPNPVEKLELDLVHLPFDGRVSVVVWRIDESHADFWPQWEKDRAAHGITDADYYQSRDMPDPAHALLSQEHIDFWKSRESAYVDQAELRKASILYAEVKNGRLTVDLEMPCFAVALIEVQEIP